MGGVSVSVLYSAVRGGNSIKGGSSSTISYSMMPSEMQKSQHSKENKIDLSLPRAYISLAFSSFNP
jgi:hypothetical protein